MTDVPATIPVVLVGGPADGRELLVQARILPRVLVPSDRALALEAEGVKPSVAVYDLEIVAGEPVRDCSGRWRLTYTGLS